MKLKKNVIAYLVRYINELKVKVFYLNRRWFQVIDIRVWIMIMTQLYYYENLIGELIPKFILIIFAEPYCIYHKGSK